MTRADIHSNFVRALEEERARREWTIPEMAEALGIAKESYKNIIYGKTNCIDIELACRLYDLTHHWMWQMCGYATSDFEVLDEYSKLTRADQELMHGILKLIIERNNNDNR